MDTVKINGLESSIEKNPNGNFSFSEIPESICKIICDVNDKGKQWSPTSRCDYSYKGLGETKSGIQFGTAKAAVQHWLIENNIQKIRFDIYTITPNGSKTKLSIVKSNNPAIELPIN